MSEIKVLEGETNYFGNPVIGCSVTVQDPDTEATAIIKFLEDDGYEAIPRFYVESCPARNDMLYEEDRDKLTEKLEGLALTALAEADEPLSGWARQVLEQAGSIWEQFKANSFKETEIKISDDESLYVNPCTNSEKEIQSMNDVEYYIAYHDVIQGGSSLYGLAADAVNAELLVRLHEENIKKLQAYYDKNIHPIRNIPYEQRTEEQHEQYGYYSDRHKELFGHRPHDESRDECYKAHMAKQKEQRGAERD